MQIKKSDVGLLNDAKKLGLVAAMTGMMATRDRTPLNNELSNYFRQQMPKNFYGIIEEEDVEDALDEINEYIKEHQITKFTRSISMPYSSGENLYLIPITENLQVEVLVVDEYEGDGDYSKFIEIAYFVITENTTKSDVDELVLFTKRVFNIQ